MFALIGLVCFKLAAVAHPVCGTPVVFGNGYATEDLCQSATKELDGIVGPVQAEDAKFICEEAQDIQ